jgi:hypothetical protein
MTEEQERFEALRTEPTEDLTPKYRSVFSNTDIGREVLADLLCNQCWFGSYLNPDSKEHIGAYNVGIAILSSLGVISGKREKKELIKVLLELPVKDEL